MELDKVSKRRASVGGVEQVPDRGLEQWEVELVQYWKQDLRSNPKKSHWIRGWLRDHGPDYSRSIHKNHCAFCTHPTALEIVGTSECVRNPGTYKTTRTMLYLLKKGGGVEVDHTEPAPGTPVNRYVYTISDDDADVWDDPYGVVYGR